MREKLEVELVDGLRLTLRNMCVCMGCYYAEDDWELSYVGETKEDLIAAAAEEVAFSRIHVSIAYLEKVQYLEHGDYKLVLEKVNRWGDIETAHETIEPGGIVLDIKATDAYKKAEAEWERQQEEEKLKKEEEARARIKQKELKTLARLKAKYADSNQ